MRTKDRDGGFIAPIDVSACKFAVLDAKDPVAALDRGFEWLDAANRVLGWAYTDRVSAVLHTLMEVLLVVRYPNGTRFSRRVHDGYRRKHRQNRRYHAAR